MRQDERSDVYRAAYEAANMELNEILGAFEQLRVEKNRLEQFLTALEPEIGLDGQIATANFKPLSHRSANLTVVTHSTAVWVKPQR